MYLVFNLTMSSCLVLSILNFPLLWFWCFLHLPCTVCNMKNPNSCSTVKSSDCKTQNDVDRRKQRTGFSFSLVLPIGDRQLATHHCTSTVNQNSCTASFAPCTPSPVCLHSAQQVPALSRPNYRTARTICTAGSLI